MQNNYLLTYIDLKDSEVYNKSLNGKTAAVDLSDLVNDPNILVVSIKRNNSYSIHQEGMLALERMKNCTDYLMKKVDEEIQKIPKAEDRK